MRITVLGTGSADGWPNAFCACPSCRAERSAGRSRAPASALLDDTVLIDCGPTTTHAASRFGASLLAVDHVLVTHGHPDHLDPAFLLARAWAHPDRTLSVWAPPLAVEQCRPWVGPNAPVSLQAIRPGDELGLLTAGGAVTVRVLPAAHANGDGDALAAEAVIFDITAVDGSRLLYATDTGVLPAQALDLMTRPFDVVLVDATFGDHVDHRTGHLDLSTLPQFVGDLRARGLVSDSSRVVATHLSHHNPPTPVLRDRLAALAIELPEDGEVIRTDQPTPRRLLVTGGARSGKSRHAEQVASSWGTRVVYLATATALGDDGEDDGEWDERVVAHRSRRPGHWSTVETADVAEVLRAAGPGDVVLVDCLTVWLTAHLDRAEAWSRVENGDRVGVAAEVAAAVDDLVAALEACPADVVLVTNEVGGGIVPASASGRLFRDLLGQVNAAVAHACGAATLVVAGHALALASLAGDRP